MGLGALPLLEREAFWFAATPVNQQHLHLDALFLWEPSPKWSRPPHHAHDNITTTPISHGAPERPHREAYRRLTVTKTTACGAVIHELPPTRPSTIARAPTSPSLGALDALPAELSHLALGALDFQSLSRLSRASLSAKALVKAHPAYVKLMTHAPEALTALSRTRLVAYHPVGLLWRALRDRRCAACSDFAGYLFLPTAERICHDCLGCNEAFHVAQAGLVAVRLVLSEEQMARLPVLCSSKETYTPINMQPPVPVPGEDHWKPRDLICVRQARNLCMEVHGEDDPLDRNPTWLSNDDEIATMLWHEVPLDLSTGRKRIRLLHRCMVVRWDGRRAAVRFPHLAGGEAERGAACAACQHFHLDPEWDHGTLCCPSERPSGFVKPERGADWARTRLRPRAEHLEHLAECWAVPWLLKQWECQEDGIL